MKLAKELIRLMSEYYVLNKLNRKMISPVNKEYMEILKPSVINNYLSTYGYMPGLKEFSEEIKSVPKDLLTRLDFVIKGSVFLYLNEILSGEEVKRLLNIESTGVLLYKKEPGDNFGAYDIVISLLSVLFGKVSYNTQEIVNYPYIRLIEDKFYGDQPVYYYGYKAALSYNSLYDIMDNIDGFISESPELQEVGSPNRLDILGMIRINNKFTKEIIDKHGIDSETETEMENLGLYNVALNLKKIDEDKGGLGNVLFDFYKAVNETTRYSDDNLNYEHIQGDVVKEYSKYIDTVINLDTNRQEVEKIGNIIRNIQNFLFH